MQQANLFEFRSFTLKINYSAGSIDGKPQMSIIIGGTEKTYRGDQLRYAESEIGTMVSVTLSATPDLKSEVFTLIVPRVNVAAGERASIRTKAFQTCIRSSIGGPGLVSGQVQIIEKIFALRGKASAVTF